MTLDLAIQFHLTLSWYHLYNISLCFYCFRHTHIMVPMGRGVPGMSIASLRKHYYLLPLYAVSAVAAALVVGSSVRAIRDPSVSWARHSNPEPWNKAHNKQFSPLRPSLATNIYKDI